MLTSHHYGRIWLSKMHLAILLNYTPQYYGGVWLSKMHLTILLSYTLNIMEGYGLVRNVKGYGLVRWQGASS